MDFVIYGVLLTTVVINFAGYVYLLAYTRFVRPWPIPDLRAMKPPDRASPITVIVPVHNEEEFIQGKLAELGRMASDAMRLRVLVVDGGSTDRTIERVQAAIAAGQAGLELITVARANKIEQLNAALRHTPQDHIVVQTDADASLDTPDGIALAAAVLESEPEIGLVGGWTTPDAARSTRLDCGYWDKQNRLRYMETVCFSSSIVVAPFYAFRRRDFDGWPLDCVADDIYISFVMHERKARVLYTPQIRITEARQPTTFRDLMRHKYRKLHAFTTETLRFAHRLPHMRRRAKMLLLFKLLHLLVLPWCLVLFSLWCAYLAAIGYGVWVLGGLGAVVLASGFASMLMTPPPGMSRGGLHPRGIVPSVVMLAAVTVLLIANVFIFPFWKQQASYARYGNGSVL